MSHDLAVLFNLYHRRFDDIFRNSLQQNTVSRMVNFIDVTNYIR